MIQLKALLKESIVVQGVRLEPRNPTSGGPIQATWQGVTSTYAVSVNTMFYDGLVGITKIWDRGDGKFAIRDNTGKTFNFNRTDIDVILKKIKQQASRIAIAKTGADITMNKTS
jgi:hypothetical protein